ncbi:MAG: hypothetical protein ACREM2_04645 [Vulcanimicrobiaceae bacterium]
MAAKWPSARERARAEVRDSTAWNVQDRYRFSFWDAAIVAAAKASSCRYLLTEDLQADQDIAGLIVVNPFRRRPGEFA